MCRIRSIRLKFLIKIHERVKEREREKERETEESDTKMWEKKSSNHQDSKTRRWNIKLLGIVIDIDEEEEEKKEKKRKEKETERADKSSIV